nr:immunoglobulin heavy chain junction region [Macaca mulatta]MOV49969.1 immunoglobulin heavy chain junction region [Macaca mulatta]MOV51807.1 immunoglobulin heavy chain junction region [Macaca mulatta]MOV52659.1 immunoglobulin heavy chain junction region [Macaca mulatta]
CGNSGIAAAGLEYW